MTIQHSGDGQDDGQEAIMAPVVPTFNRRYRVLSGALAEEEGTVLQKELVPAQGRKELSCPLATPRLKKAGNHREKFLFSYQHYVNVLL